MAQYLWFGRELAVAAAQVAARTVELMLRLPCQGLGIVLEPAGALDLAQVMAGCEHGLPGVVQGAVLVEGEPHHVRALGLAALAEELPLVPAGRKAPGDLADVPVDLDERGGLECSPSTHYLRPSWRGVAMVRRFT